MQKTRVATLPYSARKVTCPLHRCRRLPLRFDILWTTDIKLQLPMLFRNICFVPFDLVVINDTMLAWAIPTDRDTEVTMSYNRTADGVPLLELNASSSNNRQCEFGADRPNDEPSLLHCHDLRPVYSNETAWKKLVVASSLCFIFAVGEVIGREMIIHRSKIHFWKSCYFKFQDLQGV